MVVGENQKFAGALIIPDFNFMKGWCQRHNVTFTTPEELLRNDVVVKRFDKEIARLNAALGDTEKIKVRTFLADEWTVANGMITPTLKVRRKIIVKKYQDVIDKMFASKN